MEKRHFPEIIHSIRIYLKKHDLSVADTVFAYVDQDRERLMRFLPWLNSTRTVEDESDYIKMTHVKWDQHELYDYGIFSNTDNVYMGNVGIHSITWACNRCEIGYWILG